MDKKVAIVGLGRWGKVLLKELKKQTEVKYECDSKTDLNQIFADLEVRAVFIATPTATHFDIAFKALEAGKHVFLEKPGTTSSANLEKLVQKAKEKNLKFAVGYEFPHHPAAQKLKALTATKTIKNMIFDWQKLGTFRDDAVPHLLSHEISIMKFLGITDFTLISYKETGVISPTDIIETEFRNIKLTINRASPIKQKTVTVLTDNGDYTWSNDELFSINKEGQRLEKIAIPVTTSVSTEITDFLDSIQENREPMINGQFAIEVYKIIESVKA